MADPFSQGSTSSTGITKWQAYKPYIVGDQAISSADFNIYVRKTIGSGATDPSTDGSNWQALPTGVKSIQRGVLTGDTGATATISSVNTSKTELRMLGLSTNNTTPSMYLRKIVLTNSTTITMTNSGASGETTSVSWELTERY